jgi:outer membrane receptor protein involved in Fe transport
MRPCILALLPALSVLTVACDGKPLTGPDAQRAFTQAIPILHNLPAGALVFVNGARLASGSSLDQLAPATIASIEVIKGRAARTLYGKDGDRGVIHISTTDSALAERITTRP